jgi:hypothetical protein
LGRLHCAALSGNAEDDALALSGHNLSVGNSAGARHHNADAVRLYLADFYRGNARSWVILPEAVALGQAELGVDNCGLVGIAIVDGENLRAIALFGSQDNIYAIIALTYLHSCDLSRRGRYGRLHDQNSGNAAQESST